MLTGFKKTALLRTAIELKLFDAIGAGTAGTAEIVRRLGTDPRATGFLLAALASTGLLLVENGAYRLPPGAGQLLVTTNPAYVGGIHRVAAGYGEWEVFGRLTETVRTGTQLPDVDAGVPDFAYWIDFAAHTTPATAKGAAMVADILDPWLRRLEKAEVLDVGCGSGAFGLELAARHAHVHIGLQDWPGVLVVAGRRAKARKLAERVDLLPGDAFLAGVLKPGGRLVISSFMTGDGPAEAEHAHLLNLLMLSWTRGGELLTPCAYQDIARAAGLTETEAHRRPGVPLQAVVAIRPVSETVSEKGPS
jgi:hypothetical protein